MTYYVSSGMLNPTDSLNGEVMGLTPTQVLLCNNLRQVVYTLCASVTKRHNLVLAKGQ